MFTGPFRRFLSCIFLLACGLPVGAQVVPNHYTVLLEDPPVASRFQSREEMRSAPAAAYRTQIEAKQQALRRELESRDVQVTGSVADLLNAVFVTAPVEHAADLLNI